MKRIAAHAAGLLALQASSDPDVLTEKETKPMETKPLPREDDGLTGTQRAEMRALEKRKANLAAEQARMKRAAKDAKVSNDDVFFDGGTGQAVLVKGKRVGLWKQIQGKFVLFNMAGEEVTRRARQRDLKKMAVGLYEVKGIDKPLSRQVRRRLARKGW